MFYIIEDDKTTKLIWRIEKKEEVLRPLFGIFFNKISLQGIYNRLIF